jgi:hypothetical protein
MGESVSEVAAAIAATVLYHENSVSGGLSGKSSAYIAEVREAVQTAGDEHERGDTDV